MSRTWIVIIVIILLIIIGYSSCKTTYNNMVTKNQDTQAKWSMVESQYQRRNDLYNSVVKTIQGSANFEQSTLVEVVQARAKASQVTVDPSKLSPDQIAQFQQAQDQYAQSLAACWLRLNNILNCARRRHSRIFKHKSKAPKTASIKRAMISISRCSLTIPRSNLSRIIYLPACLDLPKKDISRPTRERKIRLILISIRTTAIQQLRPQRAEEIRSSSGNGYKHLIEAGPAGNCRSHSPRRKQFTR